VFLDFREWLGISEEASSETLGRLINNRDNALSNGASSNCRPSFARISHPGMSSTVRVIDNCAKGNQLQIVWGEK
jgi:hypothetical protein